MVDGGVALGTTYAVETRSHFFGLRTVAGKVTLCQMSATAYWESQKQTLATIAASAIVGFSRGQSSVVEAAVDLEIGECIFGTRCHVGTCILRPRGPGGRTVPVWGTYSI